MVGATGKGTASSRANQDDEKEPASAAEGAASREPAKECSPRREPWISLALCRSAKIRRKKPGYVPSVPMFPCPHVSCPHVSPHVSPAHVSPAPNPHLSEIACELGPGGAKKIL